MDITQIDKNFAPVGAFDPEDQVLYDIDKPPFKVYGLMRDEIQYRRIPKDVAEAVGDGVVWLSKNTAGGRVRFITDSPYISLYAEYEDKPAFLFQFPISGTAGFDLYSEKRFLGIYAPRSYDANNFKFLTYPRHHLGKGEKEYTFNFPLYTAVKHVYIGLKKGSVLKPPSDYALPNPIVYYGSSITQGGCASRPGNSYEAIISRELNVDYVNLGFSGSAKAQDEIVEYIAGLPMAAFVYDYDHNAPTLEHYKNTHEKMFKRIRETHPDIPILMLTRPEFYRNSEIEARINVMLDTYNNAKAAGDENVYYIIGSDLISEVKDLFKVDASHPNDIGFMSMAKNIGGKLKEILEL